MQLYPCRSTSHPIRLRLVSGFAAGLVAVASAFAQDAPQLDLARTKLTAGMHLIDAQLAQTPQQRTQTADYNSFALFAIQSEESEPTENSGLLTFSANS